MKLDLERTASGRSRFGISGSFELDSAAVELASVELTGELTVDNLESRFLVTGSLLAKGDTECGRCLTTFTLVYDVPVEIMVIRDLETDEGEGESMVIRQRIGEVDLAETLRESAILAVPLKMVCRDDCRGLCPQCGEDLNLRQCSCPTEEVDPRWDGLPD